MKFRGVRVYKQLLLIFILATGAVPSSSFAAHKGISFQAVLKKPDGTYPTVSGLNVTLQILDPVSECVLREEVHSGVNISAGYINLVLGAASASTPAGRNPTVVLTIPQALDNSTPRTGLNCVDHDDNIASTNQTYTPSPNDARKLRLRATIGGDSVVADFNMRSVAYAVNAENLEGKSASAFVQTSAATTQANVESVFLRYAALDAILNGNFSGNASTATALATAPGACPAGQYMTAMTASGALTCGTPAGSVTSVTSANGYLTVATGTTTPELTVNVGTGAGTVAAGDDARFTDARAPNGTAGGDLSGTYPNPTVAKVSGKAVTLTSPAAGDLLTYDGTKFVNSPAPSTSDATKLPLAGGTMSGAIDMGSQNLTNVGFVTMSANKSLHLSNNASDPSGLVAADKGKIWYDSTNGKVKYWDGSAAQALGVAGSGLQTFNTQTGSTQTLAIGTSGTAPGWSSASNVHTLNLPMASTASVTAGLISKTDYDSFAGKLDASSTFAGDVTGTSATTSVDKIKGKAVTPAAYAAGQTLRYDGTQWVNAVLGFSDLGSKPTTLAGYGITDAQSSTLANGKIFVGNASNVAAAVTMSGDATLSNAGALTLATVPVSKGGTGLTTFAGDKLITTTTGGALQTSACGLNQVVSFTAGGAITCANLSSLVTDFVQDGNSLGAAATLGTNDAYALNFETNNLPRVTILSDGKVGIGTQTPGAALEVAGQLKLTGGTPGAGKYLMSDATGLASWVSMPSNTIISIVSVVYGNNAGTATNSCGTYVQSLCGGATSCTYTGNNTNCGGDPAQGQGKIITVVYSCGAGNLSSTSAEATVNSISCVSNFVTGGNSFGAEAILGTNDNQALSFKTNNTKYMKISATGSVGIGATTPSGKLDVNQTTAGSIAVQAENNGTAFWKVLNPAGGATNTWNAANAVVYVGMDAVTSRSINAAGTINASGADFAEWVEWAGGRKPDMGSIISYKGSYVVVSSPVTAAFVGNDVRDPDHSILVAFAGQLPVLVRGPVREGDLIIANGDGTGTAAPRDTVSAAMAKRAVGTAWASSEAPGLKRVNVAIGIGMAGAGAGFTSENQARDIAQLRQKNASQAQELAELKARLERLEKTMQSK